MEYLPKELFALQIAFAYKIAEVQNMSVSESMLKYTSIYLRLFGVTGVNPPSEQDEIWKEFYASLPVGSDIQVDFVYSLYIKHENEIRVATVSSEEKITVGCFSYVYKEAKNIFVLHFASTSVQGGLRKDKIESRTKELTELVSLIEQEGKEGASIRINSWLLSTEAFTRLLPEEFIKSSRVLDMNLAQSNGFWGQFIDKELHLKQDLANQLLENASEKKSLIDEYFPSRIRTAEVKQKIFFDFYLSHRSDLWDR